MSLHDTVDAMETALIVGAGSGLSASLYRLLTKEGFHVGLAARNTEKLSAFKEALLLKCDAVDAAQVENAFEKIEARWGVPDLVVYNAGYRRAGPFATLDPAEVKKVLEVSAYGGFLVGQAAAKRMLVKGSGAIFFTGASASVKGYSESAPFAMGKFALRGLAQSMARELAPKNIHVAHFVIDGGIAAPGRTGSGPDSVLSSDEIAKSYLALYRQHRSAWTWELELRPWVERF
jgi:NAD(P)-dependent dehydrogenase (short-subunit alcohol dehydrogenase family)